MYSIINLSQETKKNNTYISSALEEKIGETLKKGKKVLLYLNRRGEYSSMICKNCQYIYICKNCDTTLSLHRGARNLICHTCGYEENLSLKCKKCQSTELEKIGVGTEQIETSIKNIFPQKRIFRFDADSVKTKKDKDTALNDFALGDIIIGTKMITTGFDIEGIGLIGVILLEQEMIFPGFDTTEKVFSNISQLIGRAGRKGGEYEVLIQTFIPDNTIIKLLTEKNYNEFLQITLEERKSFGYPPYKELAVLEYRHQNEETAKAFILRLQMRLKEDEKSQNYEIFFPEKSRKKYNQYFFQLIVKGDHVRNFLEIIRKDIMLNPSLNVRFD